MSPQPHRTVAAFRAALFTAVLVLGSAAPGRAGEAKAPVVLQVAPTGAAGTGRKDRFADLPQALARVAALRRQGRRARSSWSWSPARTGLPRPYGSAPNIPVQPGRR
ncbi:hypothetical protein GCM10025880_24020 [Methylorubrum aminovorans]|uniref:hypothetical protein n=1 Tax=Methylorubrum aminovorans TaxID=269069 RepID=UPI0023E9AAC1|nr:hypothetical protein [Methylorubrum aminovorans]GMA75985.1 hypothetical protein GCM10025880_24020 [Methylorubrum aminovorans]